MTPDPALDRTVCEFLGIEPRREWQVWHKGTVAVTRERKPRCQAWIGLRPKDSGPYEIREHLVYPPVSSTWEGFACGGSPAFVAELKDLENTLLATLPEPPKQAAEEAAKR